MSKSNCELRTLSLDVGGIFFVKKPNAGIYQIMLNQLNVAASEVVFMDDTLENIEAARALDIHSLHFQSTEQAIAELSQLFG